MWKITVYNFVNGFAIYPWIQSNEIDRSTVKYCVVVPEAEREEGTRCLPLNPHVWLRLSIQKCMELHHSLTCQDNHYLAIWKQKIIIWRVYTKIIHISHDSNWLTNHKYKQVFSMPIKLIQIYFWGGVDDIYLLFFSLHRQNVLSILGNCIP